MDAVMMYSRLGTTLTEVETVGTAVVEADIVGNGVTETEAVGMAVVETDAVGKAVTETEADAVAEVEPRHTGHVRGGSPGLAPDGQVRFVFPVLAHPGLHFSEQVDPAASGYPSWQPSSSPPSTPSGNVYGAHAGVHVMLVSGT
jgi:hypothetical protein